MRRGKEGVGRGKRIERREGRAREGDGEEGGRGRMERGEQRDFEGRGFQNTKIIPRV